MQIFLSYASEDRSLAEEIQLALLGVGHVVFFDKASLPAGGDYHARIQAAIKRSDLFIFLIGPNSVSQGSYALTELKFARSKWPHPQGRVLPVRLHGTQWEAIPPYLKAVTVLETEGNIPAEIVAAVTTLQNGEFPATPILVEEDFEPPGKTPQPDSKRTIQIWIALISMISALGVALITNWRSFVREAPEPIPDSVHTDTKKSDSGNAQSPTQNSDCPETTEYDYSQYPPKSKIVRRCPPE